MADTGSNTPIASKHIFLHQLSEQRVNTKVRFLCCIIEYDDHEGCLIVEHRYPRNTLTLTRALVDVNLVLETAKGNLLNEGTWLNVIGYVQELGSKRRRLNAEGTKSATRTSLSHVQAVLIWDAGSLHVDQYEQILEKHLATVSED